MSSVPYVGHDHWRAPQSIGRLTLPVGYGPVPVGDPLDRMPPHHIEGEQSVLAGCMMDADVLRDVLDLLAPEDFFRDAHASIFRTIVDLASEGAPVDAETVAERMERLGTFDEIGDDALGDICGSIAGAANCRYFAGVVKQYATLRAFIQTRAEEIEAAYSRLHTPEELLRRAAVNLQRIEAGASSREDDSPQIQAWPKRPGPAAWHGVVGDLVRAIEPVTEADPMAILSQVLVCIGNLLGRIPHWKYERTRHGLNMFMCLVGESGEGRKGSSWMHVLDLLEKVDPAWASGRMKSGLSTGEGVIHLVRDPQYKTVRDPDSGAVAVVEVDAGIDDKRILFTESEFGGMLSNMGRDGNNLSAVMRQCWDGTTLSLATKNSPCIATNPHVSVIGHITPKELRKKLNNTETANGFGNRFLWVCCKRSKELPHGGDVESLDLMDFVLELQEVVHHCKFVLRPDEPIRRDARANRLWEDVYRTLTGGRGGLVGDLTARAAPQVMRIAALYAVLDRTLTITVQHLEAALAFWRYSEESTAWIFSDYQSDPEGDLVIAVLGKSPEGLTRTQINRRCFRGHKPADALNQLLYRLVQAGRIAPPPTESGDSEGRRNKGALWTLKERITPEAARFARYDGSDDATSDDAGS